MPQKISMLNKVDNELVSKYKDRAIKQNIATKLRFSINIAGVEFNDIEEAINYAYRCGLAGANAASSKKSKEREALSGVNQDELYKILKTSNSLEHKADFLREIAKEWFPLEEYAEKKINTVNIELNELADFLDKQQ
jgi:hypothetical protein